MKQLMVMLLIAMLPLAVRADMYMCVDPQTGATSFTDKACKGAASQQEIKVNAINPGGVRQASQPRTQDKAWRSQVDARKTGTDFNSERRAIYRGKSLTAAN